MPGMKAPERARREQIMSAAYTVAAARGVERLTIRQVATEAGLSSGLVLFHFESREELIVELLEWLLERTTALTISSVLARKPPLERLCAIMSQEMRRISQDPTRLRLLFEYWVIGLRHQAIHTRMRHDLHRYREAFIPLAADVIVQYPAHFGGTTASGLAAVVVSFIKGCGLQTIIDLDHTDSRELRHAADKLLKSLAEACTKSLPDT